MGNDALAANYPGALIDFAGGVANGHITTHGSDWYWAVTAVMFVSTIVFLVLGYMKPRQKRIFHYITASITMVASIAYFSMASNIGWTPTSVEFVRSGNVAGLTRQIFYVRYIDWFITTPLLLMDLLLTAGMPWPTLLYVILVDWIMVVTGLIGALVRSSYKWGYYTFGCFALFYIGYVLLWEARLNAKRLGNDVGKTFLICGAWTFMLWMLYPIAWGVCEGGNVIPSDSEAVFYGILDILAKPVFGALLIWGHRGIDPARLGLDIKDYAAELGQNGTTHHEKSKNGTGIGTTHAASGTNTHDTGLTHNAPQAHNSGPVYQSGPTNTAEHNYASGTTNTAGQNYTSDTTHTSGPTSGFISGSGPTHESTQTYESTTRTTGSQVV